jgi:hypothetical protein
MEPDAIAILMFSLGFVVGGMLGSFVSVMWK